VWDYLTAFLLLDINRTTRFLLENCPSETQNIRGEKVVREQELRRFGSRCSELPSDNNKT
jgi:hypothetical protein